MAKSNEELNNESIKRCDEIMSLLTRASQLVKEDGAMDARVEEYIRNASAAVWEDRMYYAEHGLEDLNKLDDDESNAQFSEPTGMYDVPSAMAQMSDKKEQE